MSASVYACDYDPKPLSAEHADRVDRGGTITVGAQERLQHGVLRCFVRRGRLVVSLKRGRTRVGLELSCEPRSPERS